MKYLLTGALTVLASFPQTDAFEYYPVHEADHRYYGHRDYLYPEDTRFHGDLYHGEPTHVYSHGFMDHSAYTPYYNDYQGFLRQYPYQHFELSNLTETPNDADRETQKLSDELLKYRDPAAYRKKL